MQVRVKIASFLTMVLLVACQKTETSAQLPSVVTDQSTEVLAIQALLHKTYDQPGKTLELTPVVLQGSDAVVGWTQGDMGGRALLEKHDGQWQIVLCAGDAVKDPAYLTQVGMAHGDAEVLVAKMIAAEQAFAPERVAMFARFGTPVLMDEAAAQGEHAHH